MIFGLSSGGLQEEKDVSGRLLRCCYGRHREEILR